MAIFLVRHAETEDNAGRVIQLPSAQLSTHGRAQAHRLAKRLEARNLSCILASDLVRAVETATCVGVRLGVEVEEDPVLRERDFGDLRGTAYASLTIDPFDPGYVPPNGESSAAFRSRVTRAWERIRSLAKDCRGDLLVVTHGLVCQALVEGHLTLAPGDSAPPRWENASVTEIDAVSPWRVRRLNCVAHLENAPAA